MRVVNIALVKSIKIVLKSTKVLGRDLSEKDNINLFFFHSAVASPIIGGGGGEVGGGQIVFLRYKSGNLILKYTI